jgi:putative membrane protein
MTVSDTTAFRHDTPLRGRAIAALRPAAAVAYAIMWLGGTMTYVAGDGPPERLSWTPPAFLGLAALTLALWLPSGERVPMIVAGVIGWIAEVIGVHTSFPFGSYRYEEALGPGLLGAPLAMIAAWGVLAVYAVALASRMTTGYAVPIAAAFVLVMVDLVVDPPASALLGFWTWDRGGAYYGVPAVNFAGWFVVGLLACLPLTSRPARYSGVAPLLMGTTLIGFFTVICLSRGLLVPSLIGLALCAVSGTLMRRRPGIAESAR